MSGIFKSSITKPVISGCFFILFSNSSNNFIESSPESSITSSFKSFTVKGNNIYISLSVSFNIIGSSINSDILMYFGMIIH